MSILTHEVKYKYTTLTISTNTAMRARPNVAHRRTACIALAHMLQPAEPCHTTCKTANTSYTHTCMHIHTQRHTYTPTHM